MINRIQMKILMRKDGLEYGVVFTQVKEDELEHCFEYFSDFMENLKSLGLIDKYNIKIERF